MKQKINLETKKKRNNEKKTLNKYSNLKLLNYLQFNYNHTHNSDF